jgi:hypothetical protein
MLADKLRAALSPVKSGTADSAPKAEASSSSPAPVAASGGDKKAPE